MLSKSRVRFVRSLQQERVRTRLRLYVIEGDRMVRDYLGAGQRIEQLYVVDDGKAEFAASSAVGEVTRVSHRELETLSALATPQNVLAVVRQPEKELDPARLVDGLSLAVEAVRDPGNLGSLLRVAAWFGASPVVCSPDCVDVYNPKVVQATMGALLHVDVFCVPLPPVLEAAAWGAAVYGTVLDGVPLYEAELDRSGVILVGNEARGLSEDVRRFVTRAITIPPWTASAPGKDSLNVAVAAAVVCSELRRRGAVQRRE
ncbi:MAG: RNA methyltransferase [Candidatus Bipolaricaulis sp.]|nr:RNA methyltransferase [Candidatus Bipolaricaulis sp.]